MTRNRVYITVRLHKGQGQRSRSRSWVKAKVQGQISDTQRSILGARLCRVQQRATDPYYQSKGIVCVSVISGCMRIIARMWSSVCDEKFFVRILSNIFSWFTRPIVLCPWWLFNSRVLFIAGTPTSCSLLSSNRLEVLWFIRCDPRTIHLLAWQRLVTLPILPWQVIAIYEHIPLQCRVTPDKYYTLCPVRKVNKTRFITHILLYMGLKSLHIFQR